MFDHEEPIEYGMTLGELLKRRKRAEAREKLIAQSEGDRCIAADGYLRLHHVEVLSDHRHATDDVCLPGVTCSA